MPTELKRVVVANTTGSYAAIGTQTGRCTVTIVNQGGYGTRIAGHADTAPASNSTVYALIPSNIAANYTFDCIPAKTWVILDSATGGAYLETIIAW
jgi:hypothetical protein